MKKNKKGFTLFELLVSISIIGILTAIASVSFSSAQKKARDARRMEDVSSIHKAAETVYSVNNSTYPTSPGVWIVGTDTILSAWPVDPKGSTWGIYTYVAISGGYCICARMENNNNGNSSATDCTVASPGNFYCVRTQQ